MPFIYDESPLWGPLRQGEILVDVWEHVADLSSRRVAAGEPARVHPIHHELMIVMNAECDLLWDAMARFQRTEPPLPAGQEDRSLVPYLLACDLYREEQVRGQIGGSDIWRRVRQNQDERYHRLTAAEIGRPSVGQLPDLYMDFKKVRALPTANVYTAIVPGGIVRKAVVPPVYLHDLMHRFFGFLSRVAID